MPAAAATSSVASCCTESLSHTSHLTHTYKHHTCQHRQPILLLQIDPNLLQLSNLVNITPAGLPQQLKQLSMLLLQYLLGQSRQANMQAAAAAAAPVAAHSNRGVVLYTTTSNTKPSLQQANCMLLQQELLVLVLTDGAGASA